VAAQQRQGYDRAEMAAVAQQSGLTSLVQELASELLPRTSELARGMADDVVVPHEAFEFLRGNVRRVTESPIELTCALKLAAVLGRAVLAGDDAGVDLD
jgi:hypothetical protein